MPPFLYTLDSKTVFNIKWFSMLIKLLPLAFLTAFYPLTGLADSQSDYEKALTSYNAEAYDEAFIHLKNSLKADPDNLASKVLMGKMLLVKGYLSAAEVEFYEALQQGADINLVAEPLGNALLFQNKYQEVLDLDYVDKLIGKDKIKWLQIQASACLRLKKYDCAEKAYQDSLTISPNHQLSLNGLASLALFSKQLSTAEQYLSQAMAISTNNPTTLRLKGQLAQAEGDLEQAIEYLQQSLRIKRDDTVTLRKLADIYLQTNDLDSASAFVEEIIEQTPDDPLAILLSTWIESKNKTKLVKNDGLDKLNTIMASLSPEFIAAHPELLYISGLTAFFDGNTEQASSHLQKYLFKVPTDMQAAMLLARTYLLTQQNKKALSLLEKRQEKLIENLDSALMLGDLFIKLNQSFKAQRLVSDLDKRYADDPRLALFKIKLMTVRGKQTEALAMLDANLEQNKRNPTFLFTYSMLKLQAGFHSDALKGANYLLALHPQEPSFLNLKAGILIRLDKLDEAKEFAEESLKLEPTLFPAKFNLASIYSRKGDMEKSNQLIESLLETSAKHTETLLLKAHNLVVIKDIENALELYSDIIVMNPNNQYAKAQLAKLHFILGNYDDALYQIDRLLSDNFDNAQYLLLKAQILAKQKNTEELKITLNTIKRFGDLSLDSLIILSQLQRDIDQLDDAILSLQKAEEIAPENSFITLDRVKLLLRKQDFSQAKTTLDGLQPNNLANPNFWLIRASYASSQNLAAQAVKDLNQSLSLNPNFHQALVTLYDMSLQGVAESNFVPAAEKVIESNPNNVLAKNLLAQYFYIQQNFEQATQLYLALLDSDRLFNRSEIFNKLAIMSIESDLDKSASYIQQALALDENSAKVLDTFGWILNLQGKYEEGLGYLRKAYARNSNEPEIKYHLGFSLAKLGRIEDAKVELTQAVNMQRPFYNRAKAQALLDQINSNSK
ncbi:PEP-CTERM system TPR-repeat protein PrsT [Paraglaciecola aquimarina]|uniref:PEP-CTERM system TPR-repeat protein PrsT n=1 Tax=Paraglaciecola aquimarina TaxID=1235557 RepID=A0ABU3SX14_9ALTE|nr:XrtA/PEP-CTERM system TPR-repeat protein PrsT [Paraglaciecola aquimarina]MDU0354533.1 PEP-CTERM system TPR-repeat protein PrsT [Paraglaciecola aquimarina]